MGGGLASSIQLFFQDPAPPPICTFCATMQKYHAPLDRETVGDMISYRHLYLNFKISGYARLCYQEYTVN